jgi:hypothetical protein
VEASKDYEQIDAHRTKVKEIAGIHPETTFGAELFFDPSRIPQSFSPSSVTLLSTMISWPM